jgi:hypothetical protein
VQNLSAAVTAMRAAFPNPGMIVVSGYSAGGYGTFAGYGVTRVAYPDTPIVTFNDSGPGLQNPDDAVNIAERDATGATNNSFRRAARAAASRRRI